MPISSASGPSEVLTAGDREVLVLADPVRRRERAGNSRFAPGRRQPTPRMHRRASVLVVLGRLELALAGLARAAASRRLLRLHVVDVVLVSVVRRSSLLRERSRRGLLLGPFARGVEPLELRGEGVLLRAPPLLVVRETGAGGNQAADDHVRLETAQVVAHTPDRGLGQHAGRLLERSRRDERLR